MLKKSKNSEKKSNTKKWARIHLLFFHYYYVEIIFLMVFTLQQVFYRDLSNQCWSKITQLQPRNLSSVLWAKIIVPNNMFSVPKNKITFNGMKMETNNNNNRWKSCRNETKILLLSVSLLSHTSLLFLVALKQKQKGWRNKN